MGTSAPRSFSRMTLIGIFELRNSCKLMLYPQGRDLLQPLRSYGSSSYADPTLQSPDKYHDIPDDLDSYRLPSTATRVTHHVAGAICSLGYAVSQQGARRSLYEMSIADFDF